MAQKKTLTREDWMDRKWRPAMAWMYLVVCVTDFIVFPVAHAWLQARYGDVSLAWEPLTLKGGGLFHVAMGAILGISAWSRGKEKITKFETDYFKRTGTDDGYGNEGNATTEGNSDEAESPSEPAKKKPFYRYGGK